MPHSPLSVLFVHNHLVPPLALLTLKMEQLITSSYEFGSLRRDYADFSPGLPQHVAEDPALVFCA